MKYEYNVYGIGDLKLGNTQNMQTSGVNSLNNTVTPVLRRKNDNTIII